MPITHLERRDTDTIAIVAGGVTINTQSYANGGGKPQAIKNGQIFQGRIQGGSTRDQIFGTHDYGSGYPNGGILRGTNGRGFPFYFWPVAWTNPFTIHNGDAYLHPLEYGLPDNITRPGGPLATLTYISNMPGGSTFRILTDWSSAALLISSLGVCSPFVNLSSPIPSPYLQYAVTPLPEQTIQYYRASSVALTLDGYNNTAALVPQTPDDAYNVLLPGNTDIELMECLNATIGSSVILYNPRKGLSTGSIILITLPSIVLAFLLLYICTSYIEHRKMRVSSRRPQPRQGALGSPSLPCTIQAPLPQPPSAVVVMPVNGELSSGKAGELWYEEHDSASLTKNAQGFAGVEADSDPPNVNYDRASSQTPSWWVQFGGRSNKGFENIEMGGKR
ncbi:hypothetical protein H0H92_005196 [Tricholoma furcatifolium]|nr:hypothetical protein H0H92_005196 [Tricholoma furcatifolium]